MPVVKGDHKAFTLVELLVVIAIIALLASVTTAALARARASADKATAAGQMRQIGSAINLYAGDNHGYLPGPLKVGQGIMYDPGKGDQLPTLLGSYLGVTDLSQPQQLDVFLPPAFERAMKGVNLKTTHPYVMLLTVTLEDGTASRPFGDDKAGAGPLPLGSIPPGAWILTDADQANPAVKNQPWKDKTPAKPVHGDRRLALFFDGRVEPISEADIPLPPTGGPPPPPPKPPK
jgi:prepilin-type N-terminal cleavage/methylation domain-containing protein